MPKYDKDGKVKSVNSKTTTKYEGRMPERYLELCRQGGSTPQFLAQEDIARSVFDEWCDKYPAMKEAKIKGKKLAEAWWLSQAQKHLVVHNTKHKQTRFDTNLYKFIVGGRFGHTADREAHKRLDEIERKLAQNETAPTSQGAFAVEAECEQEPENNGS